MQAAAPDAVAKLDRCVQLAEMAVSAEPKRAPWHSTLAAVLYRAGRFETALAQLNKSVEFQGEGGTTWDFLLLAMIHHRLNHPQEAKEWLAKARQVPIPCPAASASPSGSCGVVWTK